jgi:hypothetical protein
MKRLPTGILIALGYEKCRRVRQVIDDSHRHRGHAESLSGSESAQTSNQVMVGVQDDGVKHPNGLKTRFEIGEVANLPAVAFRDFDVGDLQVVDHRAALLSSHSRIHAVQVRQSRPLTLAAFSSPLAMAP